MPSAADIIPQEAKPQANGYSSKLKTKKVAENQSPFITHKATLPLKLSPPKSPKE